MTRRRVFVALSGGVDSAVAAALLKRRGFDVFGVFMKPWQTPGAPCLWESDRRDAQQVASVLDIPLLTWDFSRQYGRRVAAPMVRGYRQGTTPNPDVECNRHIKFGLFADRAFREGADLIATGHYAQLRYQKTKNEKRVYITAARDKNKDQTYFLWAVPEAVLARTLFPVGHLTKPQVRAIARRECLPVAFKKDSQGVCFVGEMDMKGFLVSRIRTRPGRIIHVDGRVLGRHDGAAYYTIGQRHGLDIRDGGGPYFVVSRNVRRNIVTVGPESALMTKRARVTGARWFGPKPAPGTSVSVKIRYRTAAVPAVLQAGGRLRFRKPVRAVAPGQSAVIYRGSRLVGGGILS